MLPTWHVAQRGVTQKGLIYSIGYATLELKVAACPQIPGAKFQSNYRLHFTKLEEHPWKM